MNEYVKEIKLKTGESLVLRKPETQDAEKMIEYLNAVGGESNNLLFDKGEFRLNVEQEIEHIKNINTNPNGLMLIGLINNNVVTVAQIMGSNRKRIAHYSELSISVKKEYWANGIGSAVMEELIKFAHNHDVIRNISLGVRSENENAIKLYEKFGFERVGLHKNYFNINGEFFDEILMDLYI